MNWYDAFNAVEGVLWGIVAVTLPCMVPRKTTQQHVAVWLASAAFVVFGLSDWLELGRDGRLPLWLWGLKITCGVVIVTCRLAWQGLRRAHLHSAEMKFGLFCLAAVLGILALQATLDRTISRPAAAASLDWKHERLGASRR